MKKLVILLSIVILSSGIVYAAKYPKYDAELRKIRTVKNAQTAEINQQIIDLEVKIENLETDATISASQKSAQLRDYNLQIYKLKAKKTQISEKYKTDKERLKVLYKH